MWVAVAVFLIKQLNFNDRGVNVREPVSKVVSIRLVWTETAGVQIPMSSLNYIIPAASRVGDGYHAHLYETS